jgi:hypothetical protein
MQFAVVVAFARFSMTRADSMDQPDPDARVNAKPI